MLLDKYNYSGNFKDDDKDHDDPEFKEYQEVEYMKFKDRQERMYWAKMDERDRLRWERENDGSGSGVWVGADGVMVDGKGRVGGFDERRDSGYGTGGYCDGVPEEDRMME